MENTDDINSGWWWSDAYVPDHPQVNTFIVMDYYKSDKQIDHHFGPTFDLTKINLENCMLDEHIIFAVEKLEEYNNIIYINGTLGYYADPKDDVQFIYDMSENKIYVASNFRVLACQSEHDLFMSNVEISSNKVWKYKDNKIVEINTPEHKLEIEDDGIPYYLFPRTKDGITVPRIIYNIFKVFSDENAVKPKIIIPANFHVYSNWNHEEYLL